MKKETILGKKMFKAGFPYCYTENGYERHCKSCIMQYKIRMKRKKLDEIFEKYKNKLNKTYEKRNNIRKSKKS